MTPSDSAAYAALDLEPGAPWHEVQEAWRRLVKRHHPDHHPATDGKRLQEVNAAYAHLRAFAARVPPDGRVAVEQRADGVRARTWERAFDLRTWPRWMPGVTAASPIVGMSDRRGTVEGVWAGRRWLASVVFCGVTPWQRLSARVLDLRIGGRLVELSTPPRVVVHVTDTTAKISVTLPTDAPADLFDGLD